MISAVLSGVLNTHRFNILVTGNSQVHAHGWSRGVVHPTVARRPRSPLSDRPQPSSPSPSPASPHVTNGPPPSRHRGLLKQIPRFVLRHRRGGVRRMEVAHRRRRSLFVHYFQNDGIANHR